MTRQKTVSLLHCQLDPTSVCPAVLDSADLYRIGCYTTVSARLSRIVDGVKRPLASITRPFLCTRTLSEHCESFEEFVRQLMSSFNLSISHFNLTQYSQSAQRVLDALRLQQADVSEGYSFAQRGASSKSKGVGDETLWNALHRACLQ